MQWPSKEGHGEEEKLDLVLMDDVLDGHDIACACSILLNVRVGQKRMPRSSCSTT